MSTKGEPKSRGAARGRGGPRGRGRGRGRGAATAAAGNAKETTKPQEKKKVQETEKDNTEDSFLTTSLGSEEAQSNDNDVPMTEKTSDDDNKVADVKGKKKQQNRKRARKEVEAGEGKAADTNGDKEDDELAPPVKRPRRQDNGDKPKDWKPKGDWKGKPGWTPTYESIKGQTDRTLMFNVPTSATVQDLEKEIERHLGFKPKEIRIIRHMTRPTVKTEVVYATPEQAIKAVEKLNGIEFMEKEIKLQYTKGQPVSELNLELRGSSSTLKLTNLVGCSSDAVTEAIKKFCPPDSEDNKPHVRTIYSHGYDVGTFKVDVNSPEYAALVEKKLTGKTIQGKAVTVGYWKFHERHRKNETQVDKEE